MGSVCDRGRLSLIQAHQFALTLLQRGSSFTGLPLKKAAAHALKTRSPLRTFAGRELQWQTSMMLNSNAVLRMMPRTAASACTRQNANPPSPWSWSEFGTVCWIIVVLHGSCHFTETRSCVFFFLIDVKKK